VVVVRGGSGGDLESLVLAMDDNDGDDDDDEDGFVSMVELVSGVGEEVGGWGG